MKRQIIYYFNILSIKIIICYINIPLYETNDLNAKRTRSLRTLYIDHFKVVDLDDLDETFLDASDVKC